MNPNITKIPSLNLTKKTSFAFILIFATLVLLDSNLVKLFSFSGTEPSPPVNVDYFCFFFSNLWYNQHYVVDIGKKNYMEI